MSLDFEQVGERLARMEGKLDGLIASLQQLIKGQADNTDSIGKLEVRIVRLELEAAVVRWVGSAVVMYMLVPLIKKLMGL